MIKAFNFGETASVTFWVSSITALGLLELLAVPAKPREFQNIMPVGLKTSTRRLELGGKVKLFANILHIAVKLAFIVIHNKR